MKKVKCKNPECHNTFKPKNTGSPNEKKFCSIDCKLIVGSKINWQKNKNNPAYKKKKKSNLRIWRKKNRKHFNDLCREKSRIWQAKKREEYKNKGICFKCGGPTEINEITGEHKVFCRKCYVQGYKERK